jgi:hypothetical protein
MAGDKRISRHLSEANRPSPSAKLVSGYEPGASPLLTGVDYLR